MKIVGVVAIILGIMFGIYADIYLLIKGIVDIVEGVGSLWWNICLIAFREVVGGVIAMIMFVVGIFFLSRD